MPTYLSQRTTAGHEDIVPYWCLFVGDSRIGGDLDEIVCLD